MHGSWGLIVKESMNSSAKTFHFCVLVSTVAQTKQDLHEHRLELLILLTPPPKFWGSNPDIYAC